MGHPFTYTLFGDSTAEPEDTVRVLPIILITTIQKTGTFLFDMDAYQKELSELKEKYQNVLPICIGVELGLQPQAAEYNRQLLQNSILDFVIGSSHVVHGIDPYYPEYYEGKTEYEAYLEYFESILENIQAYDDFDVYGHIDYVVRYGPNKNADYSYRKYSDVIDEIFKQLISRGKGIELNTAGLKNTVLDIRIQRKMPLAATVNLAARS